MEHPKDLTPRERVALAVWLLTQEPFTTEELQARLGYSDPRSVERLMDGITRVVPFYRDETGTWKKVS